MSACNAKPPDASPWGAGTLVACHLRAGHEDYGIPHGWEITPENLQAVESEIQHYRQTLFSYASGLQDGGEAARTTLLLFPPP